MRVLLAFDKFKGTLTAAQVCTAVEAGLRSRDATTQIVSQPMSDGGEGFVAAMAGSRAAKLVEAEVMSPLPERRVRATYARLPDGTAIIEMASAAGLELLRSDERNPLYTTTFGVGELMVHAAEHGASRIVLGIGGSATCDAGIGCLQACGCHITLNSGGYATHTEPLCGQDLDDVVAIKFHRGARPGEPTPLREGVQIIVACDVTNPLFGQHGAAKVYGPQKGASVDDVARLDRSLESLAARTHFSSLALAPGSGAAGGLGFGLVAFLGATMHGGFDAVAAAVDLEAKVAAADVILTGEGRLDSQSSNGKVVAGVASLARKHGKRVFAIVGDLAADADRSTFDGVESLVDRFGRAAALQDARASLEAIAQELQL